MWGIKSVLHHSQTQPTLSALQADDSAVDSFPSRTSITWTWVFFLHRQSLSNWRKMAANEADGKLMVDKVRDCKIFKREV